MEAERETVTEGEPVRYRIVMSRPTSGVLVGEVYRYEGEFVHNDPSRTGVGIRSHRGVLYWEVERDTLDDVVDEANGTFTVRLQPGEGYTLGTPSSVTVRILDNDGGAALPPVSPPLVSVANVTVREGPGAVLAFTVTLDRASRETATVDWETLNGSGKAGAKAGQDYEAASGALVFAPGETVNVTVLDDALDERREAMLLYLWNPVGAIIDDAVATGIIENQDPLPAAKSARAISQAMDPVIDYYGKFACYVCQSLLKQGKDACDAPRLNARRLAEFVVEQIREHVLTEGNIRELVRLATTPPPAVAPTTASRQPKSAASSGTSRGARRSWGSPTRSTRRESRATRPEHGRRGPCGTCHATPGTPGARSSSAPRRGTAATPSAASVAASRG